ncbi:MAG: Dyp-type peroxidase [Moraxella sp.]|nr:Dyp-type peroxidase [Moraxella sp.]
MTTAQSAIIPENSRAAIVIEALFTTKDRQALAQAVHRTLAALNDLQARYPTDNLGLSIGFGAEAWALFAKEGEGADIKPFVTLGNGLAPATQCDIVFHIQSLRPDINFSLAQHAVAAFAGLLAIQDETHGFRWVENRGLDGFVDGTENPHTTEDITQIGIINEGIDKGGSYLLIQKYRHDLTQWNALSIHEQERCVGRTKADNIEFSKQERAPDSHLTRTNLKENGVGLKIVRRSLPYGTVTGEHGLLFIAYSARLWHIEAQLLSMFGETDGQVDLLLKHLSTATRGAYYFVPALDRLKTL